MEALLREGARFSVVGFAATLLHIAVAWGTAFISAANPFIANLAGFSAAFLVGYLGHYHWTFKCNGAHAHHLARFLVVSLIGFLMTNIIIGIFVTWLQFPFEIALGIIMFVVPVANFIMNRQFAFIDHARISLKIPVVPQSLLYLVGTAAVVVASFVLQLNYSLNHDTSWLLVASRKWHDGARLYIDLIEVNPPLAFYMSWPALSIADLFSLSDSAGMLVFVYLLIALSLALVGVQLNDLPLFSVQRGRVLLTAALALTVIPINVIGQREHLMIILVLPYLFLLAAPRSLAVSGARGAFVALIALPGLLLKPYFLALPLFHTLYALWRERQISVLFSPANLVIGAGAVLYLLLIYRWHPQYIERIVPLARDAYAAYGKPVGAVLNIGLFLLVGLPAAMWILLKRRSAYRRAGTVLLIAMFSFFAAYLLQFKGYTYHLLPLQVTAFLLVGWLLATSDVKTLFQASSPGTYRHFPKILIFGSCFMLLLPPLIKGPYQNAVATLLKSELPREMAGRSVIVLSTNVYHAFPLVNDIGAKYAGRYPAQWLVPEAYRQLADQRGDKDEVQREKYKSILTFARATMAADIARSKPEFVIIDKRQEKSYFWGTAFDYIDFLKADERFAQSWRNYEIYSTPAFFEIWKLKSSGPFAAAEKRR